MHFQNKFNKGAAMLSLAMILLFNIGISQKPKKLHIEIRQMSGLEQRIDEEPAEKNNMPDKYAFIISGDSEKIFEDNIASAYNIFLENGFSKENIYILNSGTKNECYPADGMASVGSIGMVLEHLAKKVDDNDMVFVYITPHGRPHYSIEADGPKLRVIPIPAIAMPTDEMLEPEFTRHLQQIKPGIGILIAEQCYGGSFAENIGKENRYIGISASGPMESAWYYRDMSTFATAFFNAWQDKASDSNKDGRVSIKEAYDYARNNDIATKKGEQVPRMYYMIKAINPAEVFLDNE